MKIHLRGAVIGFGFIAQNGHIPAYLSSPERFTIVAVADSCAARRELARKLLPGARIYASADELLAAESGQLDFVDIATPPCDHATIAHAAFDRGLHVFCEKPIATSASDAVSMMEHARTARRVFFPSHNYKHAPVVRAVRKLLEEDTIGPVRLVTLDTFRTTHARGVPEWFPDWRRSRRYSGGGIAMDHGSHTFYLAFDWLGSYPTSITAKMSHLGAFDTEDQFSCTLTFPTGIAVAQLTWNAGVRKVIYTLHGERGAITIEDDDIEVAIKAQSGHAPAKVEKFSAASHWMDASHAAWFRPLQAQFADAIVANEYVGQNARDSLMCIRVIEAAYQSSRGGSGEIALRQESGLMPGAVG
jgi:predicted dehydrogenase